jgi:uncharacterized protein (UPF0548 family)
VNRPFEDVAKLKYLDTTLTVQNWMHDDFKIKVNLGNACYHSIQSILLSYLLSRNAKVKTKKKRNSAGFLLYGCEI